MQPATAEAEDYNQVSHFEQTLQDEIDRQEEVGEQEGLF